MGAGDNLIFVLHPDMWTLSDFRIESGLIGLMWETCDRVRPIPEYKSVQYPDKSSVTLRATTLLKLLVELMHRKRCCRESCMFSHLRDLLNINNARYSDLFYNGKDNMSFNVNEYLYTIEYSMNHRPTVPTESGPCDSVTFNFNGWHVYFEYYGRGRFYVQCNDYDDLNIWYSYHSDTKYYHPGTRRMELDRY